jgi:hypothetical protein
MGEVIEHPLEELRRLGLAEQVKPGVWRPTKMGRLMRVAWGHYPGLRLTVEGERALREHMVHHHQPGRM